LKDLGKCKTGGPKKKSSPAKENHSGGGGEKIFPQALGEKGCPPPALGPGGWVGVVFPLRNKFGGGGGGGFAGKTKCDGSS